MDPLLERIPPQELDAEMAVLGCMLYDGRLVDEVAAVLKLGDFYRHEHQTVYQAILAVHERNETVDAVTVLSQLRKSPETVHRWAELPGYLADCISMGSATYRLEQYVRLVKVAADRRRVIAVCTKGVELAYDLDVANPLDTAASLVLEGCFSEARSEASSLAEIGPGFLQQVDEAMACYAEFGGARVPDRKMTGWSELDTMTLGIGNDHLIYLAARPAMGKSSFLMQLGRQIAQGLATGSPVPVLAFSLEMGKREIYRRLACSMAGLNARLVMMGNLRPDQREALNEAERILRGIPLHIVDSSSISVMSIRAEARKMKALHGDLGAVLVDYIQLIGASPDEAKGYKRGKMVTNREQEISSYSRNLKNLTRELEVPVIAAAQLSRAVEARQNKRPMLSDLRESGSLEQDANQVWFLYRDDVYNVDSLDAGMCEVIAGKNRDGETGTVKLAFDRSTTSFYTNTPQRWSAIVGREGGMA